MLLGRTVTHWLKAVKAAGTLDADAVAVKMRETPLNDFYNRDVHIQANGCVPHTMYLWQVKDPPQSKQTYDIPPVLPGVVGQTYGQDQSYPAYAIAVGYNHVFSPTLTNEVHVGYDHFIENA